MFLNKKIRNRINKVIMSFILLSMLNQVFAPTVAFALTSGPTAPEATSFEPIDTTDMVNPLTGDFTYNLPLLEVPGPEGGYPLSLSYHAGIQPNEDASWVGLGWTLNPGAITRSVNGFPDDWSGSNVSRRDYWEGGTRKTYNIGVSVGLPGPVGNVSFGLSFSQDTYKGFGVGMDVGVGIKLGKYEVGKSGFGLNASFGISPYGETYAGIGVDYGGKDASGLSRNIGLGLSTNFESISANVSGSFSSMGASISSNSLNPSFSLGGISGSASNSKAGKISTSSSGFSFSIPIAPGFGINLGYSKIRYWSDETSNTDIKGSMYPTGVFQFGANPDNVGYDSYALLDYQKNIVENPDPGKSQGGAFPDFDVYAVNSQGLSGNIRPYRFNGEVISQNRSDENNTRLVQYFNTKRDVFLSSGLGFRFVNDFSNSYRQNYPDYSSENVDLKTTDAPFDTNPSYGNNDGNFGYSAYNKSLAGSKFIQYYTKGFNGEIAQSGFIKPKVDGLDRSLHRSGNSHVEGFKITNSSGVSYHYNLPAFSYDEEVYQEKNGGNSSNRQIRKEGYAYTWYLTSITGPDYVDRNNDQMVNEGDWGYWVNFEYGKWSDNYVWRNPSEGFHRDDDNEFLNVSMGKKEVYYLNAIRTRSHVALFEKDVRLDGRGASQAIFAKNNANNKYINPGASYDLTSEKSLSLRRVYLLNATDANSVSPQSSGSGFYSNVLETNDIESVGRANLESKAIRIIDFNYNYDLCKETSNSFNMANDVRYGKLTLNSLIFRGVGGANLVPPVEFDYDLSGTELKTADGTLSQGSFVSSTNTFEPGDLVETNEDKPSFCGVVTKKEWNGSNYTYTLKNSSFVRDPVYKQLRTTKNPPYNKDAYDMWGSYKSDYQSSSNENLSRSTSEISNRSADVWNLRKIKTSLGSEINVDYEGDTYRESIMNNSISPIINGFSRVGDRIWEFTVSGDYDLSKYYQVNDQIDFFILKRTIKTVPFPVYVDVSYSSISSDRDSRGVTQHVLNVTGNVVRVQVGQRLDQTMTEYHVSNVDNAKLLTGNLTVPGFSKYYGGGVRVKSLAVGDLLGNISQTNYDYNSPGTEKSSGVTSYEPSILSSDDAAQYGQTAKDTYRAGLYSNVNELYSIAREIPSPGVMYEYVSVTNAYRSLGQSSSVPGKTIYQYEVFRKNMIGRVEASVARTGTYGGKTQYTKNIVLKKFIGALGALKKITKYDTFNKKLSETVNHYLHDGLESLPIADFMTQYENRLQRFAYQGLLKERYSEVKEVRESTGNYSVKATLSAKEEYPIVPLGQSSKDYVTGLETGTENIAFDFYSGALTQTIEKDTYGNRFLTEIVPAYRKYSAMGLKAMEDMYHHYSNMLTQEASKTIYKVDAANQYLGIVSASAQTWGNDIRVDDENGNQTAAGQADIWRQKAAYSWMTPGVSAGNITPVGIFTPYNHSGTNSAAWKKTGELTRYNVYSASLEASDLNSHYAATKMGYKNSKVIVTGSPARYAELAYTGAEDPLLVNGNLSTNIALGSGVIDHNVAHTGSNSIRLGPGTKGLTYTVPLSALDPIRRDYHIKVWAKSSGDVSNARLFYQIDNQDLVLNTPSFNKVAAGWYLLEMRIPASVLSSGSTLVVGCQNIGGGSSVNFDDFRFQPFNSSSNSYVYSNITGQLTHVIDNHNLFVKYDYDAIGRLIKVSKETLGKGIIPVVKEIAYNYSKPIKIITSSAQPFYARLEMSNFNVADYGSSDDQLHVESADIHVRFYSDAAATIPFTLNTQTLFEVRVSRSWDDAFSSGSQTYYDQYNVAAGSGFFLGNVNLIETRYYYDSSFGTHFVENSFQSFSLVPYLSSPYTPLTPIP